MDEEQGKDEAQWPVMLGNEQTMRSVVYSILELPKFEDCSQLDMDPTMFQEVLKRTQQQLMMPPGRITGDQRSRLLLKQMCGDYRAVQRNKKAAARAAEAKAKRKEQGKSVAHGGKGAKMVKGKRRLTKPRAARKRYSVVIGSSTSAARSGAVGETEPKETRYVSHASDPMLKKPKRALNSKYTGQSKKRYSIVCGLENGENTNARVKNQNLPQLGRPPGRWTELSRTGRLPLLPDLTSDPKRRKSIAEIINPTPAIRSPTKQKGSAKPDSLTVRWARGLYNKAVPLIGVRPLIRSGQRGT
jgi:hypothetical protein